VPPVNTLDYSSLVSIGGTGTLFGESLLNLPSKACIIVFSIIQSFQCVDDLRVRVPVGDDWLGKMFYEVPKL